MAISIQQARDLFNLSCSKLCCPVSAPKPCIPFLYPDDGCWGRAHEMCRLMIAEGASPLKVWIYGGLRVDTSHNPNCYVRWGWHVAPTLDVRSRSGTKRYVIDPSLFDSPVTTATWKSVQGDPSATLVYTSASIFHRSRSGTTTTDPGYSQTRSVLNTYRNRLKLRSANNGPPPYFNCMTKQPGVQWYGTIAGNSSRRWFTWGWNPKWHVIWTIMPLTQCPGGPQLKWNVQVERANSNQCTYWITVTNQTPDTVRFEGRYDILSR